MALPMGYPDSTSLNRSTVRAKTKEVGTLSARREPGSPPSPGALPLPEVLSFLKETRRAASWSAEDLAKSLDISNAAAKQVIPFLQAHGYIEAADGGGWLTTVAGDTVSGSRPLRYTPEAVEAALSARAGLDPVGERGPCNQLHHQRMYAAGILQTVDRSDVRMGGEARTRASRWKRAMRSASATGGLGQDFQRHFAPELDVRGAIYLAHSAGADHGDDSIMRECAADQISSPLGQALLAVAP